MIFSKWELVEENKEMIEESFNPFWNANKIRRVRCDVYRKRKWNGTYKYKYIKRY